MKLTVPPWTRACRRDERGAVAIFVALLLLVFVALLAFVVDLAMLRVERANTQGAADSAAQSAAWASCQGKSDGDAQAAGEAVATVNGVAAQVQRTGDRWKATAEISVPPAFSSLLTGGSDLESTVTAEARSACHPSDPLPALFAGSQTCGDKTFKLSGSGNTINGDIHSNDDIIFGGENDVSGQGTYVGAATTPDKIDWTPDGGNPSTAAVQVWPASYQLGDYQSGGSWPGEYVNTGSLITESWLTSNGYYSGGVIRSGVYYSSTGFDLGSMAGAIGNVTFVSPKQIKVSPSDVQLTPFAEGLLFFSDYSEPGKCDDWGIDISGSDNDWEGVIYAPKALVKYAGSSGSTLSGSIIADTLELSGSGWTLASPSSTEPGDTTVLLMK
jgi:hypothetical protein